MTDFEGVDVIKVNHHLYARMRDLVSTGVWRVDADAGIVTRADGSPVPAKVNNSGYLQLKYCNKGSVVLSLAHRVVWESAHGAIPEGLFINHMNGQKLDNRVVNLELATPLENIAHALATGLKRTFGETVVTAKLTNEDAREIYRRMLAGEPGTRLATEFGVARSTPYHIKAGRRWARATSDLRAG